MSDSPSPPHDEEVQMALLGECLMFPEAMPHEVLPVVRPDDFWGEPHQEIARALFAACEDARPMDAVTLANYIRTHIPTLPGDFVVRLTDAAPVRGDIARHAELVKEYALRRGVIQTAAILSEEGHHFNGKRVADILSDHRVRVEDLERESVSRSPIRTYTAPELLDAKVPEPVSLVGQHLLDQGGLSLISGKGGLGKSNLMLALAVDLTLGGREWLKTPLPEEGCRTMYLWGEGGDYFAKKRLELLEQEARQASGCLVVVPTEETPDLREPAAMSWMKQLLDKHKPHLVVIDHISEWTGGMNDSDNAEMKTFLRRITGLRRYSGAHFNIIAHNRKPGENSQRGDQSEVRGASALTSSCDTVLMIDPEPGERVRITWSKVKNAAKPEPLIAKYDAATGRYIIEATKVSDGRTSAERIKEELFRAGEPLTLKQLRSGTGLADKTCRNHLDKLVATGEVVERKNVGFPNTYSLPESAY